jgi:type IV pilus assembly protein PilM
MAFDLFKPKAPPLFGLDISSSSAKLAGRRADAYRVELLLSNRWRAMPSHGNNNLEAAADAVKRAHKRLGTRIKHVAMAVPTGAVITKKIAVNAALREDELEVQVEGEANQYIPFALEEVNLDFQVIGISPTNPEEQEVMIAATRKERVEDRVAVAHLAGLKPLVMDVESFAQQTALSLVVHGLPGGAKDQNVAIVDVGANVMQITKGNDQSVYTREQAFGGNRSPRKSSRYGMSPEEAVNASARADCPTTSAEVLKPFMQNLRAKCSARCSSSLLRLRPQRRPHPAGRGSAVIPARRSGQCPDSGGDERRQLPARCRRPTACRSCARWSTRVADRRLRSAFDPV